MADKTLLDPQTFEIDADVDDEELNDLYCKRLIEKWDAQLENEMLEAFIRLYYDAMYEQWVLDSIRSALATQNRTASLTGGSYVMLKYGQKREDYRAESWGKESQALFNAMTMTKGRKNSSSSFWMKRASQMTQNLMLTAQLAQQKIRLHNSMAKAFGSTDKTEEAMQMSGENRMNQVSASAAYWMYLMQQNMAGFGF
jgi:hypothetical protein